MSCTSAQTILKNRDSARTSVTVKAEVKVKANSNGCPGDSPVPPLRQCSKKNTSTTHYHEGM